MNSVLKTPELPDEDRRRIAITPEDARVSDEVADRRLANEECRSNPTARNAIKNLEKEERAQSTQREWEVNEQVRERAKHGESPNL